MWLSVVLGFLSLLVASENYTDNNAMCQFIGKILSGKQGRPLVIDALVEVLSHADESWLQLLDDRPYFKLFMRSMTHEEISKIDLLGSSICSARWAAFSGNLYFDLDRLVNTPYPALLRWTLLADNGHCVLIKKALMLEVNTLAQPDICSLKTPDILEDALMAGRFENAAAVANLFDLKMSPKLFVQLSLKFGLDYAQRCTELLALSHEQYSLFFSLSLNDVSILLKKLDSYEPCHIERLDGSTTLSILVCTAARCARINESRSRYETILAMIDDLLKEEQAVASAYFPFAKKSPVTRAAEAKDSRLLEALCINGVSMDVPDGENGTPLQVALDNERLETVRYLIEMYGASLDLSIRSSKRIVRSDIFSEYHPGGLTALDQAIQWDRPRFVWDILRFGSPIFLEHYNPPRLSRGIFQMLRIWSYFPQYMCWNVIESNGGMTDVLKDYIWPILNDAEFLLAYTVNMVLR